MTQTARRLIHVPQPARQLARQLPAPQISLLTDFGYDEALYALRSSVRHISPGVRVEDICHNVPLAGVLIGAWRLRRAVTLATEFPGTIYVAVVDPGVGTERKGIVVRTKSGKYLVGPDNGLLSLAWQADGIDRAVEIANADLTLLHFAASSTFHGKDVFAPVAAHLANGVPLDEFGPELDACSLLAIRLSETNNASHRSGAIVDVDGFGNIRTSMANHIPESLIGSHLPYSITGLPLSHIGRARMVRRFGDCEQGELAFILSSTGYLDLVVNLGNAAQQLSLNPDSLGLSLSDGALVPQTLVSLSLSN